MTLRRRRFFAPCGVADYSAAALLLFCCALYPPEIAMPGYAIAAPVGVAFSTPLDVIVIVIVIMVYRARSDPLFQRLTQPHRLL